MEPDLRTMRSYAQQKKDTVKDIPEAKNIIRMLTAQNSLLMEQVKNAIEAGDYIKAKKLLQPAMESKEIQDALHEIGKKLG